MSPIRLLRGFATVGVWTMVSRVLGFLRDILIAALMGAGPVAEAFFVAFTLPNMFRRLFAEGAFNTAFVPLFARRLEGEGPEAARRLAEEALSALAVLLLVFTLAAQLVMPALVLLLASGFAEDGRFALAVEFGRVVFPYILFISLAALFSGALNALGHFAAAAAAPVLLNLILIAGLLLAEALSAPAQTGPEGLSHARILIWAVLAAGIAQLALVGWAARRAGMGLALRAPRLSKDVRRLAIIALPAALAAGVMQINLVVGRQVASYFDGAVGWLWYADRVFQLPLGVVGVAIGIVLLPELSRRVRADDGAGASAALNRATEFALLLTLPATVALLAIPETVTAALFERGAFGPDDTDQTALALAIYALGLPAFVLQKIVQPVYFSREDTRTPLRFALWAMVANALLAVGLAPVVGFVAAALGTTGAAWVMLWLLVRGTAMHGGLAMDARLSERLPRIAVASVAMGGVLLAGAWALDGMAPALRLGLLVAVGLAVFALTALALGAMRLDELRGAVQRS